jgi:hypothetical protein
VLGASRDTRDLRRSSILPGDHLFERQFFYEQCWQAQRPDVANHPRD